MTNNERQYLYPWQQPAWDVLEQQWQAERLPHALLLEGSQGCGNREFAGLFAKALLCQQVKHGFACGQCAACHLYAAGTHPDFIEIKPEVNKDGKTSKNIKVDQIRELVGFVSQTAMQQGRKVIIINSADSMNVNAANALLKSLEEPTANTVLLLLSYQRSRVMPTIRSRCQSLLLATPDFAVADTWLQTFESDIEKRRQVLMMAANAPLLAKDWLEQGLFELLAGLPVQLQAVLECNSSPLTVAANWLKQDVAVLLRGWWQFLSMALKQQATTGQGFCHECRIDAKAGLTFLSSLQERLTLLESSANPNPQLLLESLLIDWQHLKTARH